MAISHFIYITVIMTLTSCQKIPAHAVTSIMQDILSSKNTDQLSQFIKRAANGRMPELQMPNKRNVILEAGLPRNVARNELVQEVMMPRTTVAQKAGPTKVIMQRPNEVVMPKRVLVQNATPNTMVVQKQNEGVMPMYVVMQQASELTTPTKIIIKKPELAMPNKVLAKNPEAVSNRRILVQKANEIPMMRNLILQNGNAVTTKGPLPNTVVVTANEEPQAARYASEKVVASNPFLPVASPGSSLTSTMSNAIPHSKGQFLRKIPIPPPTI